MNSSNRLWLAAAVCVMICFCAGVLLSSRPQPRVTPVATPASTSLQDPAFSAPHKVDPVRARKTPAPHEGLPDIPGVDPDPTGAQGKGSITLWTYQENSPLYAGNGLNQPVLQRLPVATQVFLLREEDDWAQVQVVGGQTGWLRRNQLGERAPTRPGQSGKPSEALHSLQGYFQDLNAHNYARAYDRLSAGFKTALSYRTFAGGYSSLYQISMRVVRIQNLSPQSQIFYVEILSEEKPKTKGFRGEYTLVLENGQWRMDQIQLTEVEPRSLAPFPAQSAPVKPAFADPTPEPAEEELIAPEE